MNTTPNALDRFADTTALAPCTHNHRKDSTREACLRERTMLAQHAAWRASIQPAADAAVDRIRERLLPTWTDFYALDPGGDITCTAHAGFYLAQSIQWHPDEPVHHTPLGTWIRQTERDIALLRYAIRDLPAHWSDYPCETCHQHATAPRDAGDAEAEALADFLENDLSDAELAEIDATLEQGR